MAVGEERECSTDDVDDATDDRNVCAVLMQGAHEIEQAFVKYNLVYLHFSLSSLIALMPVFPSFKKYYKYF